MRRGLAWFEVLVILMVLLAVIGVGAVALRSWVRESDRANACLLIRNAQQGVRSHCGIMGVETLGVASSYRAGVIGDGDPTGFIPLHEAIFGPGSYVETTTVGVPPKHPVDGAAFCSTLGNWDLVPPRGVLYMTSMNLPSYASPEDFMPDF